MSQPMKVLLVQRRPDQGRLRQSLQGQFGLDFEWRRLLSENELRLAAAEFAPNVIVCADDMLAGSPRAKLEVLGMLAKQLPTLLICEVCEDSAPWSSAAADVTAPWLRPHFEESESSCEAIPREAAPGEIPTSAACRPQLPATLRSNSDAVLLLDGKGWVTDLNPHAQQLLGLGAHQRPKAQAHVQDLILSLRQGAESERKSLPLVALNLDGLLLLNEQTGERFGDAALDLIASVVQPQFARCGLLARVGANQYLAIVPHLSPAADAAISVGGGQRTYAERDLSVMFGTDSINDADIKPASREQVQVSRLATQRRALPVQVPAPELSESVEWHALSVHFQPQYELASGRGCGAEALARWTLSDGRHLAPEQFIPIAERSGTLSALDAWVLKSACTAALRWRGAGAERLTLAVNVSDRQVGVDYTRILTDSLAASRLPARRLELEINEHTITSGSPMVRACLLQWKQLGVRIAVNHRSANYSTLNYLANANVDRLKLDRSLIQRMTQHRGTASTVEAIIALCAELKVDVVAEGVETAAQLEMLRDFNCPKLQGFLLARPMPEVQAQLVLGKHWGNFRPTAPVSRMALAQ